MKEEEKQKPNAYLFQTYYNLLPINPIQFNQSIDQPPIINSMENFCMQITFDIDYTSTGREPMTQLYQEFQLIIAFFSQFVIFLNMKMSVVCVCVCVCAAHYSLSNASERQQRSTYFFIARNMRAHT